MRRLLTAFVALAVVQIGCAQSAMEGLQNAMDIQREQISRMQNFMESDAVPKRGPPSSPTTSTITFSNPAAKKFFVDGTKIPDVKFDAGPSWSGLMPISGAKNETRKLFFWFWPTTDPVNTKDLVFWTNGGPGCSSLEGFLQENGPISWSWGQAEPTPNPWSWTKLSHVLWVEQPVGTGFSQGTPDISNDDELGAELMGFLEQFLEVFKELKGNNLWLTGESYAGFSNGVKDVPYIANWIYEHPGLDLALKGIWIADPSLTYGAVQQEIPALRFAQANKNLFPFNSTFWGQLQQISDTCGYTNYLDKYVTYPPAGPLPLVGTNGTFTTTSSCRIHSPIQRAVGVLNPVFDVYRVSDTWPNLWSVLGFPRATQEFVYFNRFKMPFMPLILIGILAPTGQFTLTLLLGGLAETRRLLPLSDYILIAEGTRIAIQNMTWGGAQGFQTPIKEESFTVKNMGVYGNMHTERKLTCKRDIPLQLARGIAYLCVPLRLLDVEFFFSGHMTPRVMATDVLPPKLQGQLDVLMIDNFDSFTWNLYQQLCLHGADVTVIRNDAISPELFPQLKINSLIISPGPGHPQTDSGISKAAIEHFQGKVPILGVCMGLECIVDLYGGKIAYAGEIMHGKVSKIRHDNRGCFKGIPQGIESIRYHSLSAEHSTLPAELAISSATEESGVIMGVRHRKYTIEAVQYHPESILSEGGNDLIRNFLALRGGLWEENPETHVLDNTLPPFPYEALPKEITSKPGTTTKIPTILEKIYAQRLADAEQAEKTPGTTLADLQTLLSLNIAPPAIPFLPRITQTEDGVPALFAEIKRASPSKGPISVTTSPATQALTYALAGAHTISVLTEPKWFLGSLQDMLHARQSVAHLPNRPAILRKDFILNRYQVLESRLWGADTLLLIVSMLPEYLLRDLYSFSLELGMEPLVEVNNAKEMEIALSLPAKVIGVNNRNLHDFQVDMNTTSRLSDMVKEKDVILCALSGISNSEDVKRYASEGVRAVLIGESLMRAKDTTAFIRELFSLPPSPPRESSWDTQPPLVKICGVRSKDEALAIADAGSDLLGLMFVKKSKRAITIPAAKEISQAIRQKRISGGNAQAVDFLPLENAPWFTTRASRFSHTASNSGPYLVGVFQDAPLEEILRIVSEVQLDMVQLHGSEPFDWAQQIPVPVIRVFHVNSSGKGVEGITRPGGHSFVLLDSIRDDGSGVSGGSGKIVDWGLAKQVVENGEIITDAFAKSNAAKSATKNAALSYPMPIILAGGLTLENVSSAVGEVSPWAVDVSGGVENSNGTGKDIEKVRVFVAKAKGWKLPADEAPKAGA
ncbi:indole-3-glycerol phosphate synthase-domain-containing protein [Panaeolus papilionaceus]|nr:indole-3-glycerol phosphate synthase-domain-containing protein [Panaeolus papilionaceus]